MEMIGEKLAIKMKDGNEYDISQFDGECEEADSAGRHFSGNCTWEFDLTESENVVAEYQGIYYMHGYADGDWGTTFTDFDFVSNEDIAKEKVSELNLYQFYEEVGGGDVESTFLATKQEVIDKIGTEAYLGEVCGKHSDVTVSITEESVVLLSSDQVLTSKLQYALNGGKLVSGCDVFSVIGL